MKRTCFFSYFLNGRQEWLPVLEVDDLTVTELRLLRSSVQAKCDRTWQNQDRKVFHIGPAYSEDPVNFLVMNAQIQRSLKELPHPEWGGWRDIEIWFSEIRSFAWDLASQIKLTRFEIAALHTGDKAGIPLPDESEIELLQARTLVVSISDTCEASNEQMLIDGAKHKIWGPLAYRDDDVDFNEYLYWNKQKEFLRVRIFLPVHQRMSVMCNVNSEFAGKWLGGIGEANPFDAAPAILQQPASACESASESKRVPYSDPDNYERNRWMYEQRAAGKKNQQILSELARVAYERGFAPIESENALRAAIESYAEHEGLPKIDGQRGRPRTNSRQATKRKSTGE